MTEDNNTVALPTESPCEDVASTAEASTLLCPKLGGTSLKTPSLCWPQECWGEPRLCL